MRAYNCHGSGPNAFPHCLLPLHSFNQLDMPAYSSFEELKRNLVLAVTEAQEGFGFA